MSLQTICVAVFIFATMIGVSPASAACSNATLKGVYGYYHGRPGGSGTPVAVVGQFTADGAGHLTKGIWTMSDTGTISTGSTTGTYSVSTQCTGTLTFQHENQSPADFNIVFDDNNMGFQMIQADSGRVQPGFGLAQGNAICGLTGKAQTFATNFLTLFAGGIGDATVGQVTLNGLGKLSGKETFSVGGTIYNMLSVSGNYTENSHCTGTVKITPENPNFTAMHFNTVVVNGGKELLLIETDNNTLLTGTAQQ